jgi:hypothetical protein
MYCLTVIIAHPDAKRPYSKTLVEHYASESEAEKRLSQIKTAYIKYKNITNILIDFSPSEREITEEGANHLISIKQLDLLLMLSIPTAFKDKLKACLMDQPLFESKIFRVNTTQYEGQTSMSAIFKAKH